jgi:hypothetical protein
MQRVHLGMRLPGTLMPAAADDSSISHQHATDARIRAGAVQTLLGQSQCLRHPLTILNTEHG